MAIKLPFRLSGNATAAIFVAGVSVAAFGVGLVTAPSTTLTDITRATRNEWRDLTPMADQSARDIGILASRRPWGATSVDPVAAGAATATAAGQGGELHGVTNSGRWRITGITRQGSRYLAVLTQNSPGQSAKANFLQVGEKLPDQRTIVAIDADSIEVEGAQGRHRIRLYWPKT